MLGFDIKGALPKSKWSQDMAKSRTGVARDTAVDGGSLQHLGSSQNGGPLLVIDYISAPNI